jgi:hypothetical protein
MEHLDLLQAVGLLVVVEEDLIMPLVVLLAQVVHLRVVVVKLENLLLLLTQVVDLVEHTQEAMLGVLVLLYLNIQYK